MTTLVLETEPVALRVEVDDARLIVHLADERAVSVPLSWFPRLVDGSPRERANWRLLGDGAAVEWPDLDEHIGVDALLAGRRSGESPASERLWRAARQSAVPRVEYRRAPGTSTWHSARKCPFWPNQEHETEILFVGPASGEMCNTCQALGLGSRG